MSPSSPLPDEARSKNEPGLRPLKHVRLPRTSLKQLKELGQREQQELRHAVLVSILVLVFSSGLYHFVSISSLHRMVSPAEGSQKTQPRG
jgi:hypothetical protein